MFASMKSQNTLKMGLVRSKINYACNQRDGDLNPCTLMLYLTICKAQVSDSRAVMALLLKDYGKRRKYLQPAFSPFPTMFSTLSDT